MKSRHVLSVLLLTALLPGCTGSLDAPLDGPSDAGEGADASSDVRPEDSGLDAALDANVSDADAGARTACGGPLPETPARILFVGNSFTFTASMPAALSALIRASGFPPATVAMRAVGGQTLEWHRADAAPDGAPARVREGWDVVVLQEFSTRPTDAVGPAEDFKRDATWFYDLALGVNPDTRVILYETFARRAGHALYPTTFADPDDMQAQLRFHYDDCAERYVPLFSTVAARGGAPPVEVARVGDAWQAQLATGEPPRLHGDDDYHPNAAGAYLTALVFFGTIYGRRTEGLPAIGVDDATAAELWGTADLITGATELAPAVACPPELAVGDRIRVDFGPIVAPLWATHAAIAGTTGPIASELGIPTGITVTTRGFTGQQTGGSAVNDLGLPAEVSQDTLWVGSFDGHAAALPLEASVRLSGLAEGAYDIELFASRDGADGTSGRLTRYTVGTAVVDLDVADNRARVARFASLSPDAGGALELRVAVSPDGMARFAYVGSLVLTRVR